MDYKIEYNDEDVSPASKVFINLTWKDHLQVNGPFVNNNYQIDNIYTHWHVESSEAFSGPLLCKIKLVKYKHNSNNWTCAIGLIRNNSNSIGDYYNYSVVLANDCLVNTQFTGKNTRKRIMGRKWEEGDEIIVKRDKNNDVYFGINDESSMVKGFDKIEGEFRVIIGFINKIEKDDTFELVILKHLQE